MQPLADAIAEKILPMNSSTIRNGLPVIWAAVYIGIRSCPRYSQGTKPDAMYQVMVAAISRVIIPLIVPSGIERPAERTSSAAWQVPSMPR